MAGDISRLESELGHHFANSALLARALTHSSHSHETLGRENGFDNEQMEFLGDAVLGFLVSARLVEAYPQYPEGKLSKLKAHLVSAAHLVQAARDLRLGEYLQLGRGEELSGGRNKRALVVDALEAVIAAIYLDGGIDPARRFVERFVIGDRLADTAPQDDLFEDYKSALQEFLQAAKLPQPKYLVVKERGPQHYKIFTVEVRIGDYSAPAEGTSKKAAAQEAARLALEHFRKSHAAKPAETRHE
ncbi:MAG: ribonuclease III [Acidobacteria bacterium]|nr:ribonuclease III [Acidobacteriota bacterium]